MKEREGIVVSGTGCVLLLAWLGFLFHRSPRFAGSRIGLAFGIAAALLMLVPLAYPIVKRIPFFHKLITPRVSLKTLLSIHVYAGIFGPVLAIIHTGHKFDGLLGVLLTGVVLLVVVSGYAARYLGTFVAHEIKDKLLLLQTARGDLDYAWGVLDKAKPEVKAVPRARFWVAGLGSLGLGLASGGPSGDVIRIAESVADLEYAIRTHELFKRWFSLALKLHIVLSILLYLLLGLHIWAEIYLGLRWSS